MPRSYGVYAVDQGKLVSLQALPMRVPDPRVGVSAMLFTPSANVLSSGHVRFILFQRDLVNSAPDKIVVRAVARLRHDLTFDAKGKAKLVDIKGSWAIRNISYEMKVTPVDDNPAMIIVQPESSGFSFAPGRYALVLKNTGYDFSVAGQITDAAQCLERADAVGMPVYSLCNNP